MRLVLTGKATANFFNYMRLLFLFSMILINLSGCGVRRFTKLNSAATTHLINGISHTRQEENQCGIACLSMVFGYWGRNDIDLSPIESSYALKAENLKKFAEQQGFFAFVYSGSPRDLKEQLDKGRPIIVMTKYIFKLPPMRELQLAKKIVGEQSNHYSVVMGYDDTKRVYIVSDPARKNPITVDRFLFKEKWAECDYLMILVVPCKMGQAYLPPYIDTSTKKGK